ncbi:MAG: hypothetical protein CME26_00535 [Gemmatimonadetes bacterium]|nr:hypothetical protein [Gemmatimonadota bacterium]
MADVRTDVRDILSYVEDHLYYNRPDLEIGGERFNASLLMSVLTGLVGGKALIVGEPGLGKTTSAEYVGALLYRLPLGTVWEAEVSGHPEQTEEKIIGRPNLGELNQGREQVVWSAFAQLPVKIVDEINRLPETKQSLILNGVDRGHWTYLNAMLINEEFTLFATANYQDRGTNTLVPPLMDRFDVMVESKHPGPNLSWAIGTDSTRESALRDTRCESAIQEWLGGTGPPSEIETLCDGFGERVSSSLDLPTLGRERRRQAREEMATLVFDTDASALMRTYLAELTFCCKYGQKRSNEFCGEGCHYTGYLGYGVKGCLSNRFPVSVRQYAQALAWLLGDSSITVEHLRLVLPYTSAHRIQWRDDGETDVEHGPRGDAYLIHRAREAVNDVVRRYTEQSGRIREALEVANRAFSGEKVVPVDGEHPIYEEIKKDLGHETGRVFS